MSIYETGKFPYGPLMKCPVCEKHLQSKTRGEFVACDCDNAAFVDQVGKFSRYGAKNRMPIPVILDEY